MREQPMVTRLDELPKGYFSCRWCGTAQKLPKANEILQCPECKLDPVPPVVKKKTKSASSKDGKKTTSKKPSKTRKNAPKMGILGTEAIGQPIVGIDPGSRYTGVVVRDGDVVLHASTLVRPKNLSSGTEWALVVVSQIETILLDYPNMIPVGVEGISDPKGFQYGQKAAINPKDIIRAGIVLGAVVCRWPQAIIVEPGGNGSQHASHYPTALIGRRKPDLLGSSQNAGTRGHEQSAYDVAGKAAKVAYKKEHKPLF